MKELTTRTGMGTCKVCNKHGVKICKKVYLDGSMHFVDEKDRSWNASTCPDCYSAKRKLKRRVPKPESMSCAECGKDYKPKMNTQKFCSNTCRNKHHNDAKVLVVQVNDFDGI